MFVHFRVSSTVASRAMSLILLSLCLMLGAGCRRTEETKQPKDVDLTKVHEQRKLEEAEVAQIQSWMADLNKKDPATQEAALNKLKDYLGNRKKSKRLHEAANSSLPDLRKLAEHSTPEMRAVLDALFVHAGDPKAMPTIELLVLLHHQFIHDAGKTGADRRFYIMEPEGTPFPSWYRGHGHLCNILRELRGRENAQVAVPLLRAYFDDLASLPCGARSFKPDFGSTLGKEFEKGSPSLDQHFGGLFNQWFDNKPGNDNWINEYEDRANLSLASGGPEGTVALLLMNEINSTATKLGVLSLPESRKLLKHEHPILRSNAARCVALAKASVDECQADLTPIRRFDSRLPSL